jgi:hypothetical protein
VKLNACFVEGALNVETTCLLYLLIGMRDSKERNEGMAGFYSL